MSGLTSQAGHLYASPLYAAALSDLGRETRIEAWNSFVIARDLPRGPGADAMGAYPMAVIDPAADLDAGLGRLADQGLVSLVLVPDPLASPPAERLASAFELCRPFKTHQLIERGREVAFTKHHRDRVRRGARRCRVDAVPLAAFLPVWRSLYAGLVDRHAIRGPADFTADYFERLALAPELVALAAFVDDAPVAMTLWFEHAGVAYNHLTAASGLGYANGANYALYGAAIDHFADAAVINLGGGAGLGDDPHDGLAAFKRGFANAQTQALICGAVLDRERYASLSAGQPTTGFFPAYRG